MAPGSKVFIQGGAGGVGSIAVQVAEYLVATVATTVNAKDVEFARSFGTDVAIDYRTPKYEDLIRDYNVVLDTLGGFETIGSMQVLRSGGTLISLVGAPDAEFARQLGKPILIPLMKFLSRKAQRAAKAKGISCKFLYMRANGQQLRD